MYDKGLFSMVYLYSKQKQKGRTWMLDAIKTYEEVDSWKTIMFLYNAALK